MQVLENEIIPEFYKRDEQGIPRGWVAKIRESMAVLTPEFSANRTVRQYTEEHYIPAATAYARRACGDSELTTAFLTWQEEIARHWNDVHFGALTVTEQDGELMFEAEVDLGASGSRFCTGRTIRRAAERWFGIRSRDASGPRRLIRIRFLFICDTNAGESPSR